MQDTCYLKAQEYLEIGIPVVPISYRKKTPLLTSWKEFQNRLPSATEIETWWRKWPDANLAIVTGKVSNLIVIDADGPEGEKWVLENLSHTPLVVKTARGKHSYYCPPSDGFPKNAVGIAPEVDIRSQGGYIIAPPSRHSSGCFYEWEIQPGLDFYQALDELPAL